MATIQTYIRDTNITNEDLLMGTSYISLNKYESRKFKVGDLKDYIVQQVNIDPTNLSLKSNGGLVRESDQDGNSILAVDLGASSITGQLANSDLANSSITINGAAISLGGSVTTPNTQLTDAQVRSKISVTGGGASYNSSTGVITLPSQFTLAQNNVTNASVSGQTLTLSRQSATDVTFTPTANDFTNTLKTKLDGIATGAEVNVNADWNSSSGDSEILNKPTIPSGNQIIDWTQSGAGTIHASNYVDNDTVYTLPAASSSALGGIKIGYSESGKNYPVELDSNKAYVNVPWTDTVYSLPLAASGTRGGVKIGYTTDAAGRNYAIQLDSEKMYVNVPWTDTVYTLPTASSSALGGIKIGYTDNGKNYAVELDADLEAYVNVPWTDTTYTLPTASSSTLGGVKVGSNLTIDGNGVLNVGAIALTTVQTAANQTAHLNLTAQEGDIVVRSDENKSYVHNGGTAGTMADYTLLLTPTDAVLSVTTTDGTYIDLTPNSAATGAINVTADLSAVDGTSDTTTRFLSKDNTWDVPSYTTETYTQHENISAASSSDNSGRTYIQDITLDSNGHVTGITSATETVTDTNTFRTVEVDGSAIGATETLDLVAGNNITLTESNGEVTIDATDTNTTYSVMGSGNSYAAGLVLAGNATHGGAFLRKDGSWQVPPDTDTNTTYSAMTTSTLGLGKIRYATGSTPAAESQTTTANRTYGVTKNSSDQLVVNVPWTDTDTDTNTFRTVTAGGNTLGATETLAFTEGSNITITENAGAVTIAATDTNTDTIDMGDGFTVSADTDTATTTITENDTLTIAGGTNVTTVSNPDGTITINATDTNTTYSAATSSALGLIKIGYSESGKNYPVELDGSNKAYVNVPWTDTDTNTTYSTATSSTLGLVKIGYSENGKNYPVELASGKMFVNVPWTDTNTNVTNHITNNADDTATGVYSFTNTGNHKFGAGGNGNIYVGNVISASAADKGFRIHSNNADVYFDYRTDSTGSHFYRQYDGSGGIHTRFEHDITSGVFRASSDVVAYYSFSDIRLKENIKPTNYGLNELLKLNPVEFKWKEKDGKEIGLIAQEVEKIVPEVIKENKRINDDTLYKQVDYEKLVPVLINSIKELNERIKKLEDGGTN